MAEYWKISKKYKADIYQKFILKWVAEGDINLRYSHASVTGRGEKIESIDHLLVIGGLKIPWR